MREILFRGKRVDNDEWIYGYYTVFTYEKEGGDYPVDRTAHYIMEKKGDDEQREEDDPKEIFGHTVGQFTGKVDGKGNRIFEGDLVNVTLCNDQYGPNRKKKDFIMPVIWNDYDCSFNVEWPKGTGEYDTLYGKWWRFEKVGNIHESPKLDYAGADGFQE